MSSPLLLALGQSNSYFGRIRDVFVKTNPGKKSPEKAVKSPCIGVCSTGIGDSVCRGCKRYCHEIIHWNAYSNDEKRAILERVDALLSQVVKAKLTINDEALLQQQILLQKVRHDIFSQPYSWVFELLKVGASQIEDLSDFGCSVLPEFASMRMSDLRDSIDEDFYVLSSVHYQRYFEVNPPQL